MGTHAPSLKYGRKVQDLVGHTGGRRRKDAGEYRRLNDEGCSRIQEVGGSLQACVSSEQPGSVEFLTSWVSSPWASGIHVVVCFGERATSVLVLAPRMAGHTELADI